MLYGCFPVCIIRFEWCLLCVIWLVVAFFCASDGNNNICGTKGENYDLFKSSKFPKFQYTLICVHFSHKHRYENTSFEIGFILIFFFNSPKMSWKWWTSNMKSTTNHHNKNTNWISLWHTWLHCGPRPLPRPVVAVDGWRPGPHQCQSRPCLQRLSWSPFANGTN